MFKKHYQKMLLFLITLGITSLRAVHYLEQGEDNKDNEQENHPKYFNYILPKSKKDIHNNIDPDDLEDEKDNFKRNNIAPKIENKEGTTFFLVITFNKQTKELNKSFFFNRDPNTETSAIKKAQNLFHCHTITHTELNPSPHVIFQLLGWLEQNSRKYTPIFIHSSSPVCITCHTIALNLFNLNIPTNNTGCWENSNIELENECPLAQQYIKSHLTLDLAKKILLPKVEHEYKEKINRITAENDKKIELLKSFLRNEIKEVHYSPLQGHTSAVQSVVISHDNQYMVSSSYDNTIRIWDLKTGKEVHYSPLKGHTSVVYSMAISHDSKYIVSSSADKTIRIWDFKTGKEVSYSPLQDHTHYVFSVAISSDNKYIVSGSGDKTLRIWHFETGTLLPYTPLKAYCYP